jgi:hypothetical protein
MAATAIRNRVGYQRLGLFRFGKKNQFSLISNQSWIHVGAQGWQGAIAQK